MAMGPRRLVSVLNLGHISYRRAWDIQQRLVRKQLDILKSDPTHDSTHNLLLLCTHSPVYTIGIRTKGYPSEEEEKLRSLGADFFRTERGGLITFHGPGQLVAYPVLDLTHFQTSVRCYVGQLEQTVISTCQKFGIEAETSPHTGVWVGDRKIAAIGTLNLGGYLEHSLEDLLDGLHAVLSLVRSGFGDTDDPEIVTSRETIPFIGSLF